MPAPNINEGDHWKSKDIEFFYNRPIVNGSINYLKKVWLKLIETLMSVKVWIIFTVIGLSTWLLTNDYITGDNLVNLWVGVVTPISIMRESFKISRIFGDIKQKMLDVTGK